MKCGKQLMTAFAALMLLGGCYDESFVSADILDGVTVTMAVQPIFSLQSDWTRRLTVKDGEASVTVELFEDTGWWRGSNLYVTLSGDFVLDEGQTGCFVFHRAPLEYMPRQDCKNYGHVRSAPPNPIELAEVFPLSHFWAGLFYVGAFVEVPGAEGPVQFRGFRERAEVQLPQEF